MNRDWQSYDSAAADHDRLAVPAIFAGPARDLVVRTVLPAAGRILDLGTGTGIAARLAIEIAPGAIVVGLDPSLEMLRVARSHGLLCLTVGAVPGLPYPDVTFDRILASFVLSHLTSYRTALLDIVRVLRPGGNLGMTTWGAVQNEFRQLWQEVAETFADKEALQAATEATIPWEDWFTDAGHLQEALEDAGLIGVEVHSTQYTTRMTIADFLALRDNSIQARFMRQTLEDRRWQEFRQTASAEFHRRFTNPIEHVRDAHIAIGTRRHSNTLPAGARIEE